VPSVGSILRELHIPWPAANEGALREAAATWHGLAETIRDNYGSANSAAESLTSNNEGAAIDAFESYWQKFGGHKGALPLGANACDAMSDACSKYADAVAETKRKIEEAGAEVAAVLTIGTIGAFFTFGATEAAADSLAAGLAAAAADAIAGLGEIAGGIAATAAYAVAAAVESEAAVGIIAAGISGAFTGVGGSIMSDDATDAVRELFGEAPLSPSEVAKDVLIGGLAGGATGGILGKLGEMGAPQLARLLSNAATGVRETNPQLFVDMMTLSKQLQGTTGKVGVGVLSSVASQLVTAQQISAEGVASDQLTDLLERLAEGGEG
jgi:uncharacterized protein YukE